MPQPAIISFLSNYGFYEVFLPFILVFAILYGILQKTHILGKDKKRLNIMVSLAIALIAIGSLQFSGILKEFITKLGFGIIVLLGLALVLGFFGVPLNNKFIISIGVLAFIAIVIAQFSNPQIDKALSSILSSSMLIGIIIIALIIYLLVRSPKKKQEPEEERREEFERPKQPPKGTKVIEEELTPEQYKQKGFKKEYKES